MTGRAEQSVEKKSRLAIQRVHTLQESPFPLPPPTLLPLSHFPSSLPPRLSNKSQSSSSTGRAKTVPTTNRLPHLPPSLHPSSSAPRPLPSDQTEIATLPQKSLIPASAPLPLLSFGSPCPVSGSFHSASAVLFIFPSQYLFSIGLQLIFSISRSAPAPSSFNPKKLYSYQPPLVLSAHGLLNLQSQGFHLLWRSFPEDLLENPN